MVVWEALDALSHQLELCKVDVTTRVTVLVDPELSPPNLALLRAALSRAGAETLEVQPVASRSPSEPTQLTAALKAADLVISTGPAYETLVRTVARASLTLAPDIGPQAFPPHASTRQRVRSLSDHLGQASSLHLGDRHGTSLTFDLSANEPSADHGVLDGDDQHVRFPAGWVASAPAKLSVDGEFVVMPGDSNISAQRSISSPVRFDVINDHIANIVGDSADADVIRALLEYADDPNAYGIARISLGLNPGRDAVEPFDDRRLHPQLAQLAAGVVNLSFGHNPHAGRPCAQTISLALPGRSVTVDGLPIITNGVLQGDFAPDVYELG